MNLLNIKDTFLLFVCKFVFIFSDIGTMTSIALSKNNKDHVNIISEAYNDYLSNESKNVITLTLMDNKTVMNVNVAMLRVFSPIINSILADISDHNSLDILLPEFSVNCFYHLTDILTGGTTIIKDISVLDEMKSLGECLLIDMDKISSGTNVRISQMANKFRDVPDLNDDSNGAVLMKETALLNEDDNERRTPLRKSKRRLNEENIGISQSKLLKASYENKVSSLQKEKEKLLKEKVSLQKQLDEWTSKIVKNKGSFGSDLEAQMNKSIATLEVEKRNIERKLKLKTVEYNAQAKELSIKIEQVSNFEESVKRLTQSNKDLKQSVKILKQNQKSSSDKSNLDQGNLLLENEDLKKKSKEDLKNFTNLMNNLHESKSVSNSLKLELEEARRTIKTLKKRETDVGYASPPSDCLLGLPSLVEEKEELETKVSAQKDEIEALKLLCDSLRNENDKMLDNFTDDVTVKSLARESKFYYSKFIDLKRKLEEANKVIEQNKQNNSLNSNSKFENLKFELEKTNIDLKKENERYKELYSKYVDLEIKFGEANKIIGQKSQNETFNLKSEIQVLKLELEEANRTIETFRNGGARLGQRPGLLGLNPQDGRHTNVGHPPPPPPPPSPWTWAQPAGGINNNGVRRFYRSQDWNRR